MGDATAVAGKPARRPLSYLFLPGERNAGDQKGDDVDDGPIDDHGSRRDADKRHTG